ncbi:MAG TPA: SUMF1/EgtB/PvdO family nonheme iron enzyme [Anaerolineales bacterium]|nr:SUMF1/EgtB/PvdO family nonheme iron enzyme [Anaerolineales bacterium]
MPEAPKQLRVFLCHSSHDKPVVREVYQKLSAIGWIDPWLDEKKLLPGQDWNMEIEQAVESSHIVLVFLTNNSVNKEGYIQRELRLVLEVALNMTEGAIFVIPLRLEDCELPRRLRAWQWLDYFPPESRTEAFERLLASLKIRATKLGMEDSLFHKVGRVESTPEPPREPDPVIALAGHDSDLDLHIPHEYSGSIFTPPPAKVKTWTFGGVEFVKIPHGEFLMGSKADNKLAEDDEKPQHKLTIPYDFLMGRFQVTNEQFSAFVKAGKPREAWGVENWQNELKHPVVNVTWHHAIAFCEWLDQTFGKSAPAGLVFRMPTEAEWEKAGRGADGRDYPWGSEFNSTNCNSKEGGRGTTTPAGVFSPHGDSPYGVCDMSGNVWEWTASLWGKNDNAPDFKYPYNSRDGRENLKAGDDVRRTSRGGSFYSGSRRVRAACRLGLYPDFRDDGNGFRVVLAPRLS